MSQHKFPLRIGVLFLLIALMGGVFAVRLYDVQIIQAAEVDAENDGAFSYRVRVTAARGDILDRNGIVLVTNRAAYNLVLVRDVLFSAENPNECLRRLTNLCAELGLAYADHFPVTQTKPYEYTHEAYASTWNSYFKKFLSAREWDGDISAPQLIRRLKDRYNIPADWTEEEARRVISVRYELDLRRGSLTTLPTYVLLSDVEATDLAALTELNIPGLNVETTTVREYKTSAAAHILGRVGQMWREEYEQIYQALDYPLDAYVGKEGMELAFETQLHGTDGLRETIISEDGTILQQYYVTEPVAGNNVELTIDINLQETAEASLASYIENLRLNGLNGKDTGKDCEGGAVVAMDVKTGEVLVCASYPTYDLSTFYEDYNTLLETDFGPLNNRALSFAYPPGSTFKMVTTIAAVDSGVIEPQLEIVDEGIYRRFEEANYTPRCMLYTTSRMTHGSVNVMEALAVSCNYYFYEIGWQTGIEKIDAVAAALGLGEETGVELPEVTGRRANAETKKELYEEGYNGWYGADTVAASIGQSEHRYTPIQLCAYTAALANQGTRYRATLLRRILSSDYQELLMENVPEIASQLAISDKAYDACAQGMRMAVSSWSGTVPIFRNYDVAVCAKTGTAEHGSGGSDHASLVLYAPMDDPQIAIAIYLEKGGQGGSLAQIAKDILDAYFSDASQVDLSLIHI